MPSRFAVGDDVQTPHGKGVVREVRNNGRLLVQVQQRSVIVAESRDQGPGNDEAAGRAAGASNGRTRRHAVGSREVDLHGLHVEDALTRIDEALDAALRAGHAELRFIHGRSGGRLRVRAARRLRQIPAVRSPSGSIRAIRA